MESLKGIGVAMVTPFDEAGKVDYHALAALVEWYIASGINYLVVLGTTAETATLSKEEKARIASYVVKINKGRLPLVLGKGGNNTAALVQEIEQTNFTGYTAILSVCPYYNRPNQEGLYQHFTAVVKASPLPVIIYNVPSRTGVSIANSTVVKLVNAYPQIIGIKDATGDLQITTDLIASLPKTFLVISGDDFTAFELLAQGGAGVISVIGGGLPTFLVQLVQLMRRKSTHKLELQIQGLMHLITLIFKEGNPTGVKYLLYLQSKCSNALRLPLVCASEDLENEIRKAFDALEVDVKDLVN